jgi:hypothetical protein
MELAVHRDHKIWIDQCAATECIRDRFGPGAALEYLIGEKLFHFVWAASEHAEFASELPSFVGRVRRFFTPTELRGYLDHLGKTAYRGAKTVDRDTGYTSYTGTMYPEIEGMDFRLLSIFRYLRIRKLLLE